MSAVIPREKNDAAGRIPCNPSGQFWESVRFEDDTVKEVAWGTMTLIHKIKQESYLSLVVVTMFLELCRENMF